MLNESAIDKQSEVKLLKQKKDKSSLVMATESTSCKENESKPAGIEPLKYENMDVTKIDKDERELRIYLDGVFDMTHYGHFRLFKQVKDKFPNSTVIVGVSGDEETIRLKGQTVMNESERSESIEFCRYVDEVICPCPWIITQEFMDKNNIDYVAHDGLPYASNNADDIYNFVKKQGRFIATQRTKGISTTGMINRIICRYNEYVLRNLKRGISRKELNVSWTRQKRIEMKHQFDIITDNVAKWMDEPESFMDDFLTIFGQKGKIRMKFEEKRKKIIQDNPTLSGVLNIKFLVFCLVAIFAIILYWIVYLK